LLCLARVELSPALVFELVPHHLLPPHRIASFTKPGHSSQAKPVLRYHPLRFCAACSLRILPLLAVLPRRVLLLLSTKSVICAILYPTIQVRSPRSILPYSDLPHPPNPSDRSSNERVTSHLFGEPIHPSTYYCITSQRSSHQHSQFGTQYKRTALPTLYTQNTPYLTPIQSNSLYPTALH